MRRIPLNRTLFFVAATACSSTSANPDARPIDASADQSPKDGDTPVDQSSMATCRELPRSVPAWATWPLPDPAALPKTPNAPSYDLSVPGTVTDQITHLTWQRTVPAETATWNDAKAACNCLVLAGHNDWRLPSRVELKSLVDFTRINPSLDVQAFPDTPAEWTWSSSPLADSDDVPQAWYVTFWDGNTHHNPIDTTYHYRCVRGGPTAAKAAFVVNPDGTVRDANTGLTWQQRDDGVLRTAEEAKTYCAELAFLGGGWRLPKVNELETLIDEGRTSPAADPVIFPGTHSTGYWCSLPLVGTPPNVWFVDFTAGIAYNARPEHAYAVRCVR